MKVESLSGSSGQNNGNGQHLLDASSPSAVMPLNTAPPRQLVVLSSPFNRCQNGSSTRSSNPHTALLPIRNRYIKQKSIQEKITCSFISYKMQNIELKLSNTLSFLLLFHFVMRQSLISSRLALNS
jgi:hypothetical protein